MLSISNIAVSEKSLIDLCKAYQVKELSYFGSRARGDYNDNSDLDLLVEFLPGVSHGLLGFAGLQRKFETLFGKKVDLVPKRGLKPIVKLSVLPDAIPIYEATA